MLYPWTHLPINSVCLSECSHDNKRNKVSRKQKILQELLDISLNALSSLVLCEESAVRTFEVSLGQNRHNIQCFYNSMRAVPQFGLQSTVVFSDSKLHVKLKIIKLSLRSVSAERGSYLMPSPLRECYRVCEQKQHICLPVTVLIKSELLRKFIRSQIQSLRLTFFFFYHSNTKILKQER